MQRTIQCKLKDNSTVSKATYIIDHILFGGLFGYDLVNVILPIMVPITYFDKSFSRMAFCMIFTGLFGIVFSYSNNRTYKGLIIDIVSGLGLYTALTLGKYMPIFMKLLTWLTLLVTGVGLAIIICRRIKKQNRKKRIIISRFLKSTQFIRRNIGIASTVTLLVVPLTLHFGQNQKLSEAYNDKIKEYVHEEYRDDLDGAALPEVREVYGDEYRLSENIDTIKLIRDDETFQKLDFDGKCEVITAILRCEGRYLGLEEFDIRFEDLDVETLGQFDPNTQCITINTKQIKDGTLPGGSADEILSTCVHECRHYYQHLVVELYANSTPEQRNLLAFADEGVGEWMENINNYHSVYSDDIGEYYDYATQAIEVDARVYARTQIDEYHKLIDELLEEQN